MARRLMVVALGLLAGVAGIGAALPLISSPPDPPSAFRIADSAPCVVFTGPVMSLSDPAAGEARHHPSAALADDGGLLVGWQVGKSPSSVATRVFGPDLTPRGPEVVVSGADVRATHPQVAASGDHAVIAWTSEVEGAARLLALDAAGRPVGAPDTLHPGGPRPALYPDLAWGRTGLWALWFGEAKGGAAWSALEVGGALRTFGGSWDGGPAALASGPDGQVWALWAARDLRWLAQRSAVLVAPVEHVEDPPPPITEVRRHVERTSLAIDDQGRMVAAWTEYPWARGGWGAWVQAVDPSGAAVGRARLVGGGDGSMIDVAAAGGVAAAAWQEPVAGGGTDVVLELLDPATAAPLCPAVRVHPGTTASDEARADVHLSAGPNGVTGVIVWHVQEGARSYRVDGRTFRVQAGGG